MTSIKQQARIAGLLYLLACITAPFSLIYVPSALLVPGDATATANRVRASTTLLRLSIADELFVSIAVILAVLAFYRVFRGVNERRAVLMATLMLVSVPISLFNILNDIAPLILVSGAGFLSAFPASQLDALTYLFLRLHAHGLIVAQIFWGLWLFPFGMLVIRSGFIPRLLGVLLMIAGFGYVVSSSAVLFLPQHARVVSLLAVVLEMGELPLLFWLLLWGAREQTSETSPPVGAR